MARNKGSGAPSGALQTPKNPQKPSRSRAIGEPDWFPGSKEAADYPLPCTDSTSNPPGALLQSPRSGGRPTSSQAAHGIGSTTYAS